MRPFVALFIALLITLPHQAAFAQMGTRATVPVRNYGHQPAAPLAAPTIAPVAAPVITAAPTVYTIRPGDILHVSVWKEDQLDHDVTVLPDGTFDFPLIGSVMAAGLTTSDIQNSVKEKLASMVPYATVTVTVKEARGHAISVIGQVARPGDIIMNRQLTVLQALSQVGGLTTYADEDDIKVLRKTGSGEISIPFDYSAVSAGRALGSNIILQPGDVIVVPEASLFNF